MVLNFLKRMFEEPKGKALPMRDFWLPEGMLAYAIGDIHGRLDLLNALLARIDEDWRARPDVDRAAIVFLGDYIDRGSSSPEVLDRLIALKPRDGIELVFLRGNHEQLMLDFIEDPLHARLWLDVGGDVTLASYGVAYSGQKGLEDLVRLSNELAAAVPEKHLEFLKSLRLNWMAGGYLFVHAGLRPGVPLHAQKPRDMMTIRRDFTDSDVDFGLKIVHGHTGVADVLVRPNRIAVDTGACYTGKLSAIALWANQAKAISVQQS